jgi:hypothetical protein
MPLIFPESPIIGQQYTSSNGDTWRWNGYAWDNLSLQSSGNYQGEWIIFDEVWRPRYYSTIETALAGAVSGDTIYLCTNTSETYSLASAGILLKDNVNINLNGNTFTYSFGNGTQVDGFRVSTTSTFKSKFQNGTVTFTGNHDGTSRKGFTLAGQYQQVEFDFTGLTVNFTGSYCVVAQDCSIDGGSFYNLSTSPAAIGIFLQSGGSFVTDTATNYFRNIEGYSNGQAGVLITAPFTYY